MNIIGRLDEMKHSAVRNYIVPGLTSWMIGGSEVTGKIRLFESERDHQENISPHSHRYAFSCLVIKGHVINGTWSETMLGDVFTASTLQYKNEIGSFDVINRQQKSYSVSWKEYKAGDWYHLDANEIHSIKFSRNAKVLFFEGPKLSDISIMLEPYVNGQTIHMGEVQEWMFLREENKYE